MKQKVFIKDLKRSCYCGQISSSYIGKSVIIMGWVKRVRDHGQLLFMDVRDKSGYVQVVFEQDQFETKKLSFNISSLFSERSPRQVGLESVVAVQGRVRLRPKAMINHKNPTGKVEIVAEYYSVLSPAKSPPFLIDDSNISESLALKYRYLDLRSVRLQKYMQLAHEVSQTVRKELVSKDFIEVATPILYKATPEGARDYLVPSRQHPGSVYALTQSPQILKQLLMIGGLDRYFQLARCFRDEDLRSDRQPEFTQIDLEMSFVGEQEVLEVSNHLACVLWKTFKNQAIKTIPSLSYDTALMEYGTDQPDLRNPLKLRNLSSVIKGSGWHLFEKILIKKGIVQSLTVPMAAILTKSRIKKLTEQVQQLGLGGLLWIQKDINGKQQSSAGRSIDPVLLEKWFDVASESLFLNQSRIVFIFAGDVKLIQAVGRFLISTLGNELGLVQKNQDQLVWIRDFPLFQYDEKTQKWQACHHPFVAPMEEDISLLLKQDLTQRLLRAQAYDLVCNGQEVASGSVRIHHLKLQQAVFQALSLSQEECEQKFGFFLEALQYGTPPHAGIAWGMERLLMLLGGTKYIRDVVAFPKTTRGVCLMSSTPSIPHREQLLDLGIEIMGKKSFK